MRTTLSLDDDVAALLAQVREKTGATLKHAVNEALRYGLERMSQPAVARRPFATRPIHLAKCYLPNLDNTWEVLAEAEGASYQQVLLIDVNVLVYACDIGAPLHEAARSWLDARLSEPGRVAMPWESTLGFLRVVTNPRIYEHPTTIARAWQQVTEWRGSENVWITQPREEHGSILGGLLRILEAGRN